MFSKTEFTAEELKQVDYVNEKLDQLRSYASRYDKGEAIDHDELQAFVDDILDNVVPVAERLAMNSHQKELQDTCVRIGYPEDYEKLKKLLADSEAMCEIVFKTFALPIKAMLDDAGVVYDFQYRMKSVYSIWRKMRIDHKEFDDVYDLFATRVVYKVPENIVLAENVDVEKLYCFLKKFNPFLKGVHQRDLRLRKSNS